MSDILTAIAARESAATARRTTRLVRRWAIVCDGRSSRRFYTHALARKIVARAKRLGLDCYLSPVTVRA